MNLDGSLKKIDGEPLFYATRVLVLVAFFFFFVHLLVHRACYYY